MTVFIETEQLDIDTVFITSQLEVQTVEVTRAGCAKKLDPNDENMKIEFQPESVRSTMEVTIEVTSLDDIVKVTKLGKLFGKNHGILGISDMVNVTHEGNFLLPVNLTLAMQPLQPQPVDELPASLVLYVEDDTIQELEQATVEQIADNLFTISTNHFCPVVCVRLRPTVRRFHAEKALRYVYDLDDPRCNILLFSKKDGKLLLLRSEIVSEDERLKKEQERTTGMGMNLLPTCTSPTIRLKNMDRVRISLANHMFLKFATGIPLAGRFIVFDRHNNDSSLSFHVEENKEFGAGSMATLEYDLDSGRNRRSLHKATFNALKEMTNQKNPTLSRHCSQDTLSTNPGLQTTYYTRQVSDSSRYRTSTETSAGIASVRDDVTPSSSATDVKEGKAISLNLPDMKLDLLPSRLPENSPQTGNTKLPKHVTKNKPQVLPGAVKEEKDVSKTGTRPASTGDKDSCSEVFSERSLTLLARQIPDHEYTSMATFLGISMVVADRLMQSLPNTQDRNQLKLRLLIHWLQNESTNPSKRLQTLTVALQDIDQKGLAEKVEEAFNNNRPFRP
ncbi:hypothetical protein KP79_PYT16352 [Mizuhopecten yessoensis]|uniref:Death domain-containing protein n=1 Tax=Mizuhopecten yessoensis TaxID=6573 RepID=A0A210QW39_MIZYE|nr:hypothetical protein KP79_PYT16352 [Mizuhopecten yessoensis]